MAPRSSKSDGEPTQATNFCFISFQTPDEARDREARRLARSHVLKRALEKKRKAEQESGNNFLITTSKDKPARRTNGRIGTKSPAGIPVSLLGGSIDPFGSLPVDSSRLQEFLSNYKARLAPEPVFSVEERLAFQSFHSVFRAAFSDPALLNAVMLTLAFATADGSINQECLRYRGHTLTYIREKLSSSDEVASEAAIGAILLLVGVEARLGMTSQVQTHLNAIKSLLEISKKKGVPLSRGIKRAIFWQDLNSTILASTRRIVDHTTFDELHWTRDLSLPRPFQLPLGFQTRSHLLGKEFTEVLKDTHALQCIRDSPEPRSCSASVMADINNHIASIQSRLVNLPRSSPLLDSCYLATYLCSVMLCCTTWCALVIPPYIASKLLNTIHNIDNDDTWYEHADLLAWMICIGGAFAPKGTTQSGFISLLHCRRLDRLYTSWPELVEILERFIWSERAFTLPVKTFLGG
ncbi:hypothetical protein GGS20DRAFT_577289 [Poronia punctata]|nr:hypothetical protein GGS20DRAFT_577289 [Poronia punctata]